MGHKCDGCGCGWSDETARSCCFCERPREFRVSDSNAASASRAFPTWQELLHACRQDWRNSDFNEENFPLEPVLPDEEEWEVCEHHFSVVMNGKVAFRRLVELGYRLCGPRRAMEFVANHLDNQLDHPLMVTARWQHDYGGDWCAPIFYRNDGKRLLNLLWLDYDFYPFFGWLVLRKHRP